MLGDQMYHNLGLTLTLWTFLYLMYWYWTIRCAKSYERVRDNFVPIASYEKIIANVTDGTRRVYFYWNRVRNLVLSNIGLALLWLVAQQSGLAEVFWLGIGYAFSAYAFPLIYNIRNLAMYDRIDETYTREVFSRFPQLTYTANAVQQLGFGGFFLLLFLITAHWYFVGGLLYCLYMGFRLWTTVQRKRRRDATEDTQKTVPPNPV
jgi:hypothetical protein